MFPSPATWWRSVCRRAAEAQRSIAWRNKVKPRHCFVPQVTVLEDRMVPSTITVTTTLDNVNVVNGAVSLRAAITAVNSGLDNTIKFANGLGGRIKLTHGELLITTSVTIEGPGANQISVSGDHLSRVFETAAGQNVTISGLTITHGYAVFEGGGILNDGSNLTLTGDNLTQNVVYESSTDVSLGYGSPGTFALGGGLFSATGTVTIGNCQISGNQALGASGTSAFGLALGGGLNISTGSVTISNSTINDNLTQAGNNSLYGLADGAGIYCGATINISDSTISDNLALGGNNTAPSDDLGGGGGAVVAAGLDIFTPVTATVPSTATVTNCTFSDDVAIAGNGGTGVFVGEAEGGAVYDGASAVFSGCTFDHNLAQAGNGGIGGGTTSFPSGVEPGVDTSYGGAICSLFLTSLTVTNCTLSQNQAVGGSNATATGADIVEVGDAEGGAICSEIGAVAVISNCTLDHNNASGGSGDSASGGKVAHVGSGLGGAIDSSYGSDGLNGDYPANTLTVSNSTITQNDATGGDKNSGSASIAGLIGAGVGAGLANYLGGTATLSGGEIDHNHASGGHHNTADGSAQVFASLGAGGAIFNYLGYYTSAPVADYGYGPLGVSAVTVTDGCLIDQNQAHGNDGGPAWGGAIANALSATAMVTDSFITQNQANGGGGVGLGGGIANLLSSTTTATATIMIQNQANGGGGGMGGGAYNDATSYLTLTACLLTQNQASGSPGIGGGVFTALLAHFTDNGSAIVDNQASTSGDNIGT